MPPACRRFPDDSGLVVDALGGDPGVYTANWAETSNGTRDFDMAMAKVEKALQDAGATKPEQRRARFISVLCLAWPDGHTELFRGEVEGSVVCRRAARRASATIRSSSLRATTSPSAK